MEKLDKSAPFKEFRSMRMKLALPVNTRPDCQLEISQLAQVTEERFHKNKPSLIFQLNKATKYAVENGVALKIPALNRDSIRLPGFADDSFANNLNSPSQLGNVCFLIDKDSTSAQCL